MSGVLRADLEALGRLSPQIAELCRDVAGGAVTAAPAAEGADPALVAMGVMSGKTLPNIATVVVGWMGAFSQVCEAGRQGMLVTEEQSVGLMRSVPGLSRS